MDKIIEVLNDKTNDEFYIEHPPGSNYFTLKFLKQERSICSSLKTDASSVLFSEEQIDKWLLKKLKKSKYEKDTLLSKLILLADNNLENDNKTPTMVNFVEKREIGRSTLCSFDGPFQLVHADVGNFIIFR